MTQSGLSIRDPEITDMSHLPAPHSWNQKFAVAIAGLLRTWRTESSMQVHSVCGLLALGLAACSRFSPIEWAILLLVIGWVIALELVNTALEAVVDLASPEYAKLARVAKDAAAAAVLVAALTAVLVGGCLFIPHWWGRWGF